MKAGVSPQDQGTDVLRKTDIFRQTGFLDEGIFKREKFEWRDFQREKLDSERVLGKAIPSEKKLESSSIDSNIMST